MTLADPRLGIAQYGWPRYVHPTWMVKEQIEQHIIPELSPEGKDENGNYGDGWRSILAARMSLILGVPDEACIRRLFDVMTGRARIINCNWVEAAFAGACDLNVGTDDVPLPTFPGNKKLAIEMAEAWGDDLTPAEQKRLARSLMNVARGFIYADEFTDAIEAAQALGGFLQAFAPEPTTVPDELVLAQNAREFEEQAPKRRPKPGKTEEQRRAHREYMREYMRNRRANEKAAA